MELIFKSVQIFICVLEAYLMFDFFLTFFPLKESVCNKYMKTAAVLCTAGCVYLVNSLDSSIINIVGMQIIYITMIIAVFQESFFRKIPYYLMATAIMAGSEFLCIIFLSHPSNFSLSQVTTNVASMIFFLLCTKLIAFILFNIVKGILGRSNNRMSRKNLLLYSVVPIATLGIMISLAYLNIDWDQIGFVHVLLIISSVLVLIGNILIFYVFDRYSQSTEKLRQQELTITKMEIEEKHYEQIERVNQEHAAFLHDIHHYLQAIGEMASENNDEEIVKTISELQIKIANTETSMFSHNKLLNAILNERKKAADEKDVSMRIIIEPEFTVDHIKNVDLIVIMGNLLDNAIEAASKCTQGYVKVFLFSQNSRYFSVIKIVNNYAGKLSIQDDNILTSKDDKLMHGFGIKNVSDISAKYGGYLQNFHENGVFTSIVILPVQ